MVDPSVVVDPAEQNFRFETFDEGDAWAIGALIHGWAAAGRWPIVVAVRLFDRPLFMTALPGATADNVDWVRRKSNVVERFHRSSLAMRRKLDADGTTLERKYGLDGRDYAASGGAIPIKLNRFSGAIGSIAVSGLKQEDDHSLVIKAVATHLGLAWAGDMPLPPSSAVTNPVSATK